MRSLDSFCCAMTSTLTPEPRARSSPSIPLFGAGVSQSLHLPFLALLTTCYSGRIYLVRKSTEKWLTVLNYGQIWNSLKSPGVFNCGVLNYGVLNYGVLDYGVLHYGVLNYGRNSTIPPSPFMLGHSPCWGGAPSGYCAIAVLRAEPLRLSTEARPTVVLPTALLGFLLWALPCLSMRTRLTVVVLTFSVLVQGGGGGITAGWCGSIPCSCLAPQAAVAWGHGLESPPSRLLHPASGMSVGRRERLAQAFAEWLVDAVPGGGGGDPSRLRTGGEEGWRQAPQRRPQKWLGRCLEEVAKAVGGDYRRLQMPMRLALAVRETVAGHRLGALEGGGVTSPPSNASLVRGQEPSLCT